MVEARFGGRPPSVLIMGHLASGVDEAAEHDGDSPPWEILAGAQHLSSPNSLHNTKGLPPVTFSISGIFRIQGEPPTTGETRQLFLQAWHPFQGRTRKGTSFFWPAGATEVEVSASLSVGGGFNQWGFFENSARADFYIGLDWTVIG